MSSTDPHRRHSQRGNVLAVKRPNVKSLASVPVLRCPLASPHVKADTGVGRRPVGWGAAGADGILSWNPPTILRGVGLRRVDPGQYISLVSRPHVRHERAERTPHLACPQLRLPCAPPGVELEWILAVHTGPRTPTGCRVLAGEPGGLD